MSCIKIYMIIFMWMTDRISADNCTGLWIHHNWYLDKTCRQRQVWLVNISYKQVEICTKLWYELKWSGKGVDSFLIIVILKLCTAMIQVVLHMGHNLVLGVALFSIIGRHQRPPLDCSRLLTTVQCPLQAPEFLIEKLSFGHKPEVVNTFPKAFLDCWRIGYWAQFNLEVTSSGPQ